MKKGASDDRYSVDLYLGHSLPTAIKFVQAQNYTRSNRADTAITLLVIHDMEGSELPDKAETVARWFAGASPKNPAPRASAHYAIDCNSIVQMVREKDIAWHAPGANHNGIGVEHAGLARQTREQWLDPYSKTMLLISAGLMARLCKRYTLPIKFVDAAGLKMGDHGITTHRAVTEAFKKSTHTDPGPNFPMVWYLEQVQTAFNLL